MTPTRITSRAWYCSRCCSLSFLQQWNQQKRRRRLAVERNFKALWPLMNSGKLIREAVAAACKRSSKKRLHDEKVDQIRLTVHSQLELPVPTSIQKDSKKSHRPNAKLILAHKTRRQKHRTGATCIVHCWFSRCITRRVYSSTRSSNHVQNVTNGKSRVHCALPVPISL
jgi:hypothetical protein